MYRGVQEAVIGGHLGAAAPDEEGCRRTLVFARDVAAAKEVAECLKSGGATVLTYHKGVTPADRDAALQTLARSKLALLPILHEDDGDNLLGVSI